MEGYGLKSVVVHIGWWNLCNHWLWWSTWLQSLIVSLIKPSSDAPITTSILQSLLCNSFAWFDQLCWSPAKLLHSKDCNMEVISAKEVTRSSPKVKDQSLIVQHKLLWSTTVHLVHQVTNCVSASYNLYNLCNHYNLCYAIVLLVIFA